MQIESFEDRTRKVMIEYREIKSDVEEIKKHLEESLIVFKQPELFDDESLEEICELLDEEDVTRLNSIKKYLKVINLYPNQSQIQDAIKILNEIKEKLVSMVNTECEYKLKEIDFKLVECINMYNDIIENASKYNQIDVNYLYKFLNSVPVNYLDSEFVDFMIELLNSDINVVNEISDIKFKYYEIIDDYITKLKRDIDTKANSDYTKIYRVLREILENKKITNNTLNVTNSLINKNEDDKDICNRIRFLFHLYKVNIPYESEQLDYLEELSFKYLMLAFENNGMESFKFKTDCVKALESDEKFTDTILLKENFKNDRLSIKEQVNLLCSLMAQNKVKKISKSKRK